MNELQLEILKVNDICFGTDTAFEKGKLTINKDELIENIKDKDFKSIDIFLAKPGESIRIIPVKDVIEPRIKVDSGTFFPGVLADYDKIGTGRTKVLKGCSVITTGSIVGFQEGIIDMSGPGASFTHYSGLNNVVIVAEPSCGIDALQHEKAIRIAGLKAANYLANSVKNVKPDKVETYKLKESKKGLPRIAYVYLVLSQGLLHNNYVYGKNARDLHPMLLHPNELYDGAIVSGNCVSACDKNTTYDHVNNPVIKELYEKDGINLDFIGVIASPISPVLKDKERCAMGVLNLAKILDADGLIISEEGGGNPETDLMMICANVEQAGIRTVLMLHENAGSDGISHGITNTTPEATAVISVGNINEMMILPKMDKTIGNLKALENLAGAPTDPYLEDGGIKVSMAILTDSASNLGFSKIRATYY